MFFNTNKKSKNTSAEDDQKIVMAIKERIKQSNNHEEDINISLDETDDELESKLANDESYDNVNQNTDHEIEYNIDIEDDSNNADHLQQENDELADIDELEDDLAMDIDEVIPQNHDQEDLSIEIDGSDNNEEGFDDLRQNLVNKEDLNRNQEDDLEMDIDESNAQNYHQENNNLNSDYDLDDNLDQIDQQIKAHSEQNQHDTNFEYMNKLATQNYDNNSIIDQDMQNEIRSSLQQMMAKVNQINAQQSNAFKIDDAFITKIVEPKIIEWLNINLSRIVEKTVSRVINDLLPENNK
jgi:hypothetical protein